MKLDKIIKKYKNSESLFSLILGIAVIIVVGNLVISRITNRQANNESPAETQTEETRNGGDGSFYVVKKGEYLYQIAKNLWGNGDLWPEIAKANNITDPDVINEGDTLSIPEVELTEIEAPDETKETISPTNSITSDKYVVMAGDNLWRICVRAYGDGYRWPEIAKANNLKNPDIIVTGQELSLPR